MKHSYRPECLCPRCTKEKARRTAQSFASTPRRMKRIGRGTRRPIVGSQEWAETRGDDLGESPDY